MYNWKTIKEYEDILFDYCDGVAKITINRPKVYNAFRPQTNFEMLDAMTICRERPDIGVIILTGAGDKAFCSGGDQNVKGSGGYIDADGHVLHVVCDLTIASENAKFGQTGPKVGSFDAGFGSSYLARCVGQKKVREIWFLCQQYTAKEAEEMGMVNKVVPFDRLEETTMEWAKIILKRSPLAIRMIKRALNAELDGQRGLMEFAGDATLMYYLMDEAQEGKNAFLEKRDNSPNFPADETRFRSLHAEVQNPGRHLARSDAHKTHLHHKGVGRNGPLPVRHRRGCRLRGPEQGSRTTL